jgi:hypothetical protein
MVACVPDRDAAGIRDPADALAAVAALRRLADQLEYAAVEQAMRSGWSWPDVAEALGITRRRCTRNMRNGSSQPGSS